MHERGANNPTDELHQMLLASAKEKRLQNLNKQQDKLLFDVEQSFEPLLASEDEQQREKIASELTATAEQAEEISKTNHAVTYQLLEDFEEHLNLPADPKARIRLRQYHALERLKILNCVGRCTDEIRYLHTLAEIGKLELLADGSDRVRREESLTDPYFEQKIWLIRRQEVDAGLLERFVKRELRVAQSCELSLFAAGDEQKIENIRYRYIVDLKEMEENDLEELEVFPIEAPNHTRFFSTDLNNLIQDIELLGSLSRQNTASN